MACGPTNLVVLSYHSSAMACVTAFHACTYAMHVCHSYERSANTRDELKEPQARHSL